MEELGVVTFCFFVDGEYNFSSLGEGRVSTVALLINEFILNERWYSNGKYCQV